MKTIQIAIDEGLLDEIDYVISKLRTNRSAFFRDAAQREIKRRRSAGLEKQHRRREPRQPDSRDEVEEWIPE